MRRHLRGTKLLLKCFETILISGSFRRRRRELILDSSCLIVEVELRSWA